MSSQEFIQLQGYSMYGSLHSWTIDVLNKSWDYDLARLALKLVASHVSGKQTICPWPTPRRLLRHVARCSNLISNGLVAEDGIEWACHSLGDLFADQGKLAKAEQMYRRALQGKEKSLSPEHLSTLDTLNNLGLVYVDQGRLAEAEQMYQRALQGKEMSLGPEYPSTFNTLNNLGLLYINQGRLAEAEQMYQRVLQGKEMVFGSKNPSTLEIVNNFGVLYIRQGKLAEAEQMYQQALQGKEKVLGPKHPSTLDTVNNLGVLYVEQGKLVEAEQMYQRALQGKERALGLEHLSTLDIVNNLGDLYTRQGKLAEAEQTYQRALWGFKKILGIDNTTTYIPALNTIRAIGSLFERQIDLAKAREMYSKALVGYEKVVGPNHARARSLRDHLQALDAMAENRHKADMQIKDRQTSSGSRRGSSHFDSGESNSSIDNGSVFSVPISLPSDTTVGSGTERINAMLTQEFAGLLYQDEALISLVSEAVSKKRIGLDRMRNNFRKLLKHFAGDLKAEISTDHHRAIVAFVSSYSTNITRELFSKPSLGDWEVEVRIPEPVGNPHTAMDRRDMVEEYLHMTFDSIESTDPTNFDSNDPSKLSDDSDQDSVAEGAGEEEPYDDSLKHLEQLECFILESVAYQTLCRRLHEFIYPTLRSRLRGLVAMWSRLDHRYHAYVTRYKFYNTIAELQYIHPSKIRFERSQKAGNHLWKIMSYYQNRIECWTGEHWDWWPLPVYPRPLDEGETRVRWECTCGEDRWAEVPRPFAKRLKSIIRSFPESSIAMQDLQPPPTSYRQNSSGPPDRNGGAPGQFSKNRQGNMQPASSSSANAPQFRTPGLKTEIVDINIPNHRVLFIVKQGAEYKLAQICVEGLSCHIFFSTVRQKYFQLRGFLRSWFSVWRYSHCDFYKAM
ncbi:uncharacterized protein BP5553_06662 [Venustampulla echinocandica]|uniref:Uncharacterized protein n=1 Tax=Venustampulla echinocandica TaxID=2656787 RepID=A0A370TKJ7_9HELO|nr:uncharacterized protein BP5553_06662 [Venustampulla echinocandica]RDL36050.1 hypothetical protein BP5553_06662 [Venustampulla echinocandica]